MGLKEAVAYALSEEAATTQTSADRPSSSQSSSPLTQREEEVAALVARGMTNRRIASELSISEHTAATHVRRILKKLGLRSRAQMGSWLTERRPLLNHD
jgi:non-specific serine/threonine protein kinase